MHLSDYQLQGYDEQTPVAALHAGLVKKSGDCKVLRFQSRAATAARDIRRFPVTSSAPSRTLARMRAALLAPRTRLFVTTSSTTFTFILGFIS